MASAAKREGRQFDMPLMDFADNLTPEDMTQWSEAIKGEDEPEDGAAGEKKRKRRQASTNS